MPWDREYRYGARAFFTLKGYASRNGETELPPRKWAVSHRRSSRLNGKNADAKQNLGFSRFDGPMRLSEMRTARRASARGCLN
jgi:hypothetical protein